MTTPDTAQLLKDAARDKLEDAIAALESIPGATNITHNGPSPTPIPVSPRKRARLRVRAARRQNRQKRWGS